MCFGLVCDIDDVVMLNLLIIKSRVRFAWVIACVAVAGILVCNLVVYVRFFVNVIGDVFILF